MDYLRQITDLANTAKDAADTLTQQARDLEERDREIEVLTTERDNALLRVEQLEGEVDEWRTNYGSGYIE